MLTRRDFVRAAAAAALAPLACDKIGREVHIESLSQPTPDSPLTPADDFYIVHNFGEPRAVAPADWRLAVRGLVARGGTLRRGDLDGFAAVTRELTLECIGNTPGGGLISSAAFTGVRLGDVLRAAGPSGHARGAHLEGEDGYFAYLSIDDALADEALLAHALGGAPLAPEHGAPVRALFPGRHGMFSVKWLRSITLARDWGTYGALTSISNVVEGVTPVRSRIDRLPGELLAGVEAEASGIALAVDGVARVEVLVDEEWRPAELTFHPDDPRLWSLWRARLTPRLAGEQRVAVRAFDSGGRTQQLAARFPYDSGAIHTVRVLVRG